jgi:hypothetical protein
MWSVYDPTVTIQFLINFLKKLKTTKNNKKTKKYVFDVITLFAASLIFFFKKNMHLIFFNDLIIIVKGDKSIWKLKILWLSNPFF